MLFYIDGYTEEALNDVCRYYYGMDYDQLADEMGVGIMLVSLTDKNCNYVEEEVEEYSEAEDLVYRLVRMEKCDVGAVNITIECNGKFFESCEICEKVVMALEYFLIEVCTIEIKG